MVSSGPLKGANADGIVTQPLKEQTQGIVDTFARQFVTSVAADANGVITVVANQANLTALTATTNTLTLVPIQTGTTKVVGTTDGGKTIAGWACGGTAATTVTGATTIPPKYLPASCRGTYP